MSANGMQLNDVAKTAQRLVDLLTGLRSVAVAWSGGVDSAVVAKAAVLALKDQAVAVTAVSPSLAESERRVAHQEAQTIGIRQIEIFTTEFGSQEYRSNTGNRCFFCKAHLYQNLKIKGITCHN